MSRVHDAELAGFPGGIDQLLEDGKLPASALWSADEGALTRERTHDDAAEALAGKLRALQGQEGGVPLRIGDRSQGQDVLVEVMEVLVEGAQVQVVLRPWRGNTAGADPEPVAPPERSDSAQ